jgi:hypothetical protein
MEKNISARRCFTCAGVNGEPDELAVNAFDDVRRARRPNAIKAAAICLDGAAVVTPKNRPFSRRYWSIAACVSASRTPA